MFGNGKGRVSRVWWVQAIRTWWSRLIGWQDLSGTNQQTKVYECSAGYKPIGCEGRSWCCQVWANISQRIEGSAAGYELTDHRGRETMLTECIRRDYAAEYNLIGHSRQKTMLRDTSQYTAVDRRLCCQVQSDILIIQGVDYWVLPTSTRRVSS